MSDPEITYICKRTVVSTKPVKPGTHYPLSVLDRLMDQNYLRIVYYFQTPKERLQGDAIKSLRESLSETLTFYPVVSGRLTKEEENGDWMVKCNDAGVRAVEARAKGSVEEWLRTVDRDKELKLVHWEEMLQEPYFWSTFYVQLTEFEEGGLAIGLSCSHLLADPICANTFIKAWADTTFTGKLIKPPLFHSLTPRRPANKNLQHKPYTHLINFYKSIVEQPNSPLPEATTLTTITTMTLSFTHSAVQACIDMAGTNTNAGQFTPFEALSGIFWVILSKIKGASHNGLINMSICLDMRKTLGLSPNYFGNCMAYNKVDADRSNPTERAITVAVKSIKQVVAEMDNEGIMDLIEYLDYNKNLPFDLRNRCDLVCANLEGLSPYENMFKQEYSPIRASYYVEPVVSWQVIILPSQNKDGGGPLSRMVMVTLSKGEAFKLLEDDLMKHLRPVIVMH